MKPHHLFLVIFTFLFANITLAQPKTQQRVITLDFNKVKGSFSTTFKECIGAGRANEGLRADWHQQTNAGTTVQENNSQIHL